MLVTNEVFQRYIYLVRCVNDVVLHGGWMKENSHVRDIEVSMIVCGVVIQDNSSMCACACPCTCMCDCESWLLT